MADGISFGVSRVNGGFFFFYQSQNSISSKSITRICKFFRILLIPVMNLSEEFLRHILVNDYFTFIQICNVYYIRV